MLDEEGVVLTKPETREILLRFTYLLEEASGDSVPQKELWRLVCAARNKGWTGFNMFGRFDPATLENWFVDIIEELVSMGSLKVESGGRLSLTLIGKIGAQGIQLPQTLKVFEAQMGV